jgi:hypothetical protein
LVVLPVIIIFLAFQKAFIENITIGSIRWKLQIHKSRAIDLRIRYKFSANLNGWFIQVR